MKHQTSSQQRILLRGLPCILAIVAACSGSSKSGETSASASGGSSGAASSGSAGSGGSNDSSASGSASTGAASGSVGSASMGPSSGSGGEADCFSAFDAASCAAFGDACDFESAGGTIYTWDGGPYCVPVDDPEFGWCFPVEHGGTSAPQAFWEPATGRVVVFATGWFEIPPGWEECWGEPGQPPCCACLNPGDHPPECDQNDSIGESSGGSGTGTGG